MAIRMNNQFMFWKRETPYSHLVRFLNKLDITNIKADTFAVGGPVPGVY